MTVKFKTSYCGAKTIYDPSENCTYCAFRTYDRRYIYFDKYVRMDTHWVDQDGVVWIEDSEGYLVEKTLEV